MKIKGLTMTGEIMCEIFRTVRTVSLFTFLMLPGAAFSKCVSDTFIESVVGIVDVKPVETEHFDIVYSGGLTDGIYLRNRDAFRFRDTVFFEIPYSNSRAALIFGVHSFDNSLLTGAAERNFIDITYIMHRVGDVFDVICSDDPKIVSAPPDGVIGIYRDDTLFDE